MKSEMPIRVCEYRRAAGVGNKYMSALIQAMKLPRHTHFVLASQVNKWRANNPNFRSTDIYPVKRKAKLEVAA